MSRTRLRVLKHVDTNIGDVEEQGKESHVMTFKVRSNATESNILYDLHTMSKQIHEKKAGNKVMAVAMYEKDGKRRWRSGGFVQVPFQPTIPVDYDVEDMGVIVGIQLYIL